MTGVYVLAFRRTLLSDPHWDCVVTTDSRKGLVGYDSDENVPPTLTGPYPLRDSLVLDVDSVRQSDSAHGEGPGTHRFCRYLWCLSGTVSHCHGVSVSQQ